MKKRHWFVRIFSFFAIFSFLINCVCCSVSGICYPVPNIQEDPSQISKEEMLVRFGFVTEEQQKAFEDICEKAGVALPDRFGTHELLQLVASTQERFVNRADKQERWETEALDWMQQNEDHLKEDFINLGLVNAALPSKTHYDAVCVLGARRSEMEKRIKFVERLVKEGYYFDWVVLLTGARPATVGIDGTLEEIEEIAQHFGINGSEVTEAYIFKYLYEMSSLSKGHFNLLVIDTPAKDGRRPTTQTTVEDFCKWCEGQPGKIEDALFISSQPHVAYQKAIIKEIFRQNNCDLSFRVAGDSYVPNDNSVKTLAGALGSYIWVASPNVLRSLNFEIEAENDLELFNKAYGHAPWLYNLRLCHAPRLYSLRLF